jgi:hypothetical protein
MADPLVERGGEAIESHCAQKVALRMLYAAVIST